MNQLQLCISDFAKDHAIGKKMRRRLRGCCQTVAPFILIELMQARTSPGPIQVTLLQRNAIRKALHFVYPLMKQHGDEWQNQFIRSCGTVYALHGKRMCEWTACLLLTNFFFDGIESIPERVKRAHIARSLPVGCGLLRKQKHVQAVIRIGKTQFLVMDQHRCIVYNAHNVRDLLAQVVREKSQHNTIVGRLKYIYEDANALTGIADL